MPFASLGVKAPGHEQHITAALCIIKASLTKFQLEQSLGMNIVISLDKPL